MAAVARTTASAITELGMPKKHGIKKRSKPKNASALPPYPLIPPNHNAISNVDDVLEAVANLLRGKKNIVVLVGAGISTSVGIPDFRSKDKGLYNTLDAESLGLSCPEDLFCIEFFQSNPAPFYKFAKHLYYPNRNDDEEEKRKAKPNKAVKKPRSNGKHTATSQKPPPTASRSSQRIKRRKTQLHDPEKPPAEENQEGDKNFATTPPSNKGLATPSDSHKLLALLEQRKMLLRVYTQNIDGLESSAGVSGSKIVYCHGSLRNMSCTKCSKKNLPVDASVLESIESGSVPLCRIPRPHSKPKAAAAAENTSVPDAARVRTSQRKKRSRASMEGGASRNFGSGPCLAPDGRPCCGGVLKPGITFFGEALDPSVGKKIESDQAKADALVVIGTSLSVAPISHVIEYLPKDIPRILINRTIVHPKGGGGNGGGEPAPNSGGDFRTNYVFDAYLLGFCDDVTRALGKQLGLGFDLDTKAAKAKEKAGKGTKQRSKSIPTKPGKTMLSGHASATGARLLRETEQAYGRKDPEHEKSDWKAISVPPDRVLLFPGALPAIHTPTLSDAAEAPAETYREVAHCDGCARQIPCGMPIFKCLRCFDYDLCGSCYPVVSKKHCDGRHSFRKE